MDQRISDFSQAASVREVALRGGKADGVRLLEIDNGVLRFQLNLEKGLDIYQLWHRGMNVPFLCKNGLGHANAPFAACFEGGMLYTCGMDSLGVREGFPVHGSLHSIAPAVSLCRCDEGGVTVEADLTDSALDGKHLVLHRRVHTDVGSDALEVCDVLENKGYSDADYCLLYHVNLGYPFLDEGVTITSDCNRVQPRNEGYSYPISERSRFPAPVDNEAERCYFIDHKTPEVTVRNEKLKKQFLLSYSGETLPAFVQWNNNASGDYVLGLEPATTYLDDLFRYSVIRPAEKIGFSVRLRISDL